MLLRTLPAPFLRTLKKTLSRCVKVAFSQEHGTPSPPYLHQIRDLSILPKMLKVAMPWWNLTLEQIAALFWQNSDDFYQVLSADTRNIDASAMQEVGRIILQYRHSIRQDLPFRLKRLHNWNVSGWTPSQAANDPKMRLIKRLLHTGPVSLQETRWHAETPQNLYHNIPGLRIAHSAGLPTERGGTSGGVAILIPPGWMLDRTEEMIPGRAVLAVLQDRYSTLGLISVYLHPQSKGDELRQLLAWAKGTKVDFPLYINGDFNQVDKTVPEVWTDFLVQAQVTDVQPELKTFEGPSGLSALDRVLCPTDYIAAAQIDVLVAAHRRHHLSGHYQLTTKFVIRPSVQSDIRDPIHQTIPSDVFCPGRTEADPYTIPNDLQELIRRLQRLQGADELEFVATLWSWWRQQPIPSSHPRIPAYELLRKYLKIRAEVLHIPAEQYRALQSVTYHLFAAPSAEAVQRDKVSIRSDVLRQMFDFHDQISASKGYANLEQINVQARGVGSNINFWNRLRSICPKGATYNGPILNQNDEHCTTSKMLDEAMLDTRTFWFVEPEDHYGTWSPVLQVYQSAADWPRICLPQKQDFLHTLLNTKDSAPGPDGIPYSAWRLSPEDSFPVLEHLMGRMISGMRAAPVQVGVWIPKAKLGPTADFFRPLGMPNTCDRLVDGTIAAVVMKAASAFMHPSQVVMNCFKEPQHAVNAIQTLLDSSTPMAALLVDLSKAFERVNPYWILHILRIRKAPTWVVNYAKYILFGRLIRHKVQGRLLPPRAVHVGVDMGRSFSVFLFCLAMDPIYHYLNRVPRVLSVQGYIDDNTIAGPSTDIEWVSGVQLCYKTCRSAGFQIDPHTCWQAISADCLPFPLEPLAGRPEQQIILRQTAHPTARSAILSAVLSQKTLILTRAGQCVGLSPREAGHILEGSDYSHISMLLALECKCRCKTALVINSPLSSWSLRRLDKSGFGAHCIQGVATSLGLLLLGRAQITNQEMWSTAAHPETLKKINPKAAEKFVQRLRLFKQPILSVVTRSIAFNTFSQSVVLYTTSYFGAATEDLQMLRAAAADLLLGRSWLRHDYIAYVFRWVKISPLLDPGLSILVSALGLFLRKGGEIQELYSEFPLPENRQTFEVRSLWRAWASVVGEDRLTHAASVRGTIKQRVNAVKALILRHMMSSASSYIQNKILVSGWTGGINWMWFNGAVGISKRWIPSMARFTLLRWAVNEDDDEWLARRGISRSKQCFYCANIGKTYPFGGYRVAVCEVCIASKQLTALSLERCEMPVLREPDEPQQVQTHPATDWIKCVACSRGDNTVGHWVRWCTVPIVALQTLTGNPAITSLLDGARYGSKHLALATRVIHQFRLLLREAGAMKHQVQAPLTTEEHWITNLTQKVSSALPSDLKITHIRAPRATPGCSVDTSDLVCQDKPPLHISCTLAPARVCCVVNSYEAYQTIGVAPMGSEVLQVIQTPMQIGSGLSPNVMIQPTYCRCGEFHCKITSLLPIGANEILCSCLDPAAGALLVQFDGSCHSEHQAGGAGAALVELQTQGLTLLRWRAVAIPNCPDNIYAEAMSANVGTDLLCEELVHRKHTTERAYLQGDILPIVKHLAFAGRFRRIDLQPIVQQIRRKQSRMFDFGVWIYRPREANVIADNLAGVASQHACDLPQDQQVPIEIQTPAPYRVAIAAGAIVIEEKAQEDTVLVLVELSNVSLRLVHEFLDQSENQKYRKDIEGYLAGTANLTRPRLVEYSATACDRLGRLYGRGPCAQRLPRKVRMFMFGMTHQEVDMIGSFYEIMRRLSTDPELPQVLTLRRALDDLLGLLPSEHRTCAVKKHPLIVMNAGATAACAKLETEYGITCPSAVQAHLSS